jgi:hypothetical protein
MLSKQQEQREIDDILSVFFVVVNGPLKKYSSFYSPHINESWTGTHVVAKWLTRLLFMREVSSSNLSPETGNPDRSFYGFSQFLQANTGAIP